MSPAETVKRFREARGMSVVDLGSASGVDVRTIRRVEAGQPGVNIPALIKILNALGVDDEARAALLR